MRSPTEKRSPSGLRTAGFLFFDEPQGVGVDGDAPEVDVLVAVLAREHCDKLLLLFAVEYAEFFILFGLVKLRHGFLMSETN